MSCRNWIALLTIVFNVGESSEPVTIYGADNHFIAFVPQTGACPIVSTGTPAVVCPPVVVSTGPYVLKATTGDCYRLDTVNGNGTITQSQPLPWMRCP